MASKVKVTVSLDAGLVRELSGASRKLRKPRSQLVEEALRLWRRRQLEQNLREGYVARAEEDRTTSEERLAAGWEAVRSVEGGLQKPSMVNLAQVLTVDRTRLQRRLGSLPAGRMQMGKTAIRISLDVE